jgi:hypothetical protein
MTSSTTIGAAQLVADVEAARLALLDTIAPLTTTQGAFKPAPDEWSVAEVVEHLFLAEMGVITKIWTALEETRAGKTWTGDLPNAGLSIEQVVKRTWKEKEIAPPAATPHFGGPLFAWATAVRSLPPLLAALSVELENEQLERIVYPHFLSGPLDARQRLEFVRFHIERHHLQVRRITSHPGFPVA